MFSLFRDNCLGDAVLSAATLDLYHHPTNNVTFADYIVLRQSHSTHIVLTSCVGLCHVHLHLLG
jgi:hypothetical protein